jgi:hypothetical protein
MAQITLSFLGIEIEESIGEVSRLRFRLNVQVGRLSNNMFTRIQFNRMSFKIDLYSGRDPTATQKVGNLGVFESLGPVSCSHNSNTFVYFSLPLNTSIVEKMLEIRNNQNFVTFDIFATISGIIFIDDPNISQLIKIWQSQIQVVHNTANGIVNKILIPSEKIQQILNQIHYTEIVRIEIPLYRDEAVINQELKASIELLKHGSNALKKGNNESAMIDVRKILTNHLLLKDNNKMRILNETIKSELINNSPTGITEIYRDVILRIQDGLRAILKITDKFLHDDNTIKVPPLHKDSEYVYFSVALIIKHILNRIERI